MRGCRAHRIVRFPSSVPFRTSCVTRSKTKNQIKYPHTTPQICESYQTTATRTRIQTRTRRLLVSILFLLSSRSHHHHHYYYLIIVMVPPPPPPPLHHPCCYHCRAIIIITTYYNTTILTNYCFSFLFVSFFSSIIPLQYHVVLSTSPRTYH